MDFNKALESLGVNDEILSQAEKDQLITEGYLIFEDILNEETVIKVNKIIDSIFEKEGEESGKEYYHEEGTHRLAELYNKDAIFDQIYAHPKILAAAYFILKQAFHLNLLNVRDVYKGTGEQSYHVDWGTRKDNTLAHAVNSIWMLDDFTKDNGATKVIPRTHNLDIPSMYDIKDFQNKEVQITGKAGSVLVFNAHLWHRGTENKTNKRRRCIHNFYCVASSNRKIVLTPSIIESKEEKLLHILGEY